MLKAVHSTKTKTIAYTAKLLPITKSDYLQFLACAPEFWLLKHYPDEYSNAPDEETRHNMQQGYAIESLAREYFKPSENLQIEFQCSFQSERLLARADIVLTDRSTGIKTLIEVKSSSKIKDEYYDDLAFQVIAAAAAGTQIHLMGVLHINSDYVLSGELNIQNLFVYEEVTDVVLARIPDTKSKIENAIGYLDQKEPVFELHQYCGLKLDCPALQRHHPNLPEYNVFHISRITSSPKKLHELLTQQIVDINDIPDDFKLSERQRLQVDVAQAGVPLIHHQDIQETLDGLQFPLYFLDYESLHYGIPLYQGIKPHQQMVFQWSLHVLYEEGQEPEHFDFLSDGSGQPSLDFAKALSHAIPQDGGSVIVWFKPFETGRNSELAQMYPEYESFFTNVNARVFDLMDVFQQQQYVHPAFKGSNSIKDVLPILAPQLSYADLAINHGNLATIRWFDMVTTEMSAAEKSKILHDLRQYCKLDTLAMVEVYKHLHKITKSD